MSPLTALVGYNNAGKTNILDGIAWLLRPYVLQASDFTNPSVPISIEAEIDGVTETVLNKLAATHRQRIEPFVQGETILIRRTQPSPGGPKNAIKLEVRDASIKEETNKKTWGSNPTGIDAAISALLPSPIQIGAMEDAAADVARYKTTSTIGRLIAQITKPIEEIHGSTLRESLDGIRRKLSVDGEDRAPELIEIDQSATAKLAEFFPGLRVKLHVPAPELQNIFGAGTLKVYEEDSSTVRDVTDLGHGAQRSIQMALIRYLAELSSESSDAGRTILLIDEPELYLHPQAVEQMHAALRSLSNGTYQVIFSTHSPLMVTTDTIRDTLLVHKGDKGTCTRPRLADTVREVMTDALSQTRTLLELENASQILFSDMVLLVEGKTESRILPGIYRAEKGATLGQAKIGLVRVGGATAVANCMKVLSTMGIPTKALVDLDFAFRAGPKARLIDPNDTDVEAVRQTCRRLTLSEKFDLAEDGFPKKSKDISAADAFAKVAKDSEAAKAIQNLHTNLKSKGIWLWRQGSIEHHIGLEGHSEEDWADFLVRLQDKGCQGVTVDYKGLQEFLEWLDNNTSGTSN